MSEDGLKIPNVQRIKRANGKIDLYFRKGDYREGPLSSADGTPELKEEVDAIMSRLGRAVEAANKPRAGTVGGMLKAYNKSAEYLALARSTQSEYQNYIDELTEDIGDVLLRDVTRSWVMDLRAMWAQRGHRAAENRLQVLKNALSPAIDDDTDKRIPGDPFHKIKKVPRPHGGGESHPIWTDEEIWAAIHEAKTKKQPGLARAIALGRFGGFRRGTICAIPLNARTTGFDKDGNPHARLSWITEKRQVMADKREDPRLTEVLTSTPNQAMTIAYNARGQVWKERQLNQALDRLLAGLAKKGAVRAATDDEGEIYCPLTIHGLRHSRGVELALAGASDAEIMTQLEHSTPRAAQEYRRQADRRRMADAAQDKVDVVVSLRDKRSELKSNL
jgi:hypothetical protein